MIKNSLLILRGFLFTILIIICLAFNSTSIYSEDDPPTFNSKNFGDFIWGSNLKKYPQLDCKYNHMSTGTDCSLRNGDLKFLSIDLISYYYSMNQENKFDYVEMRIKDRSGWMQMKDNLVEILGDQYIGNLAGGHIVYTWKKDDLKIELSDNNPEINTGEIYLFLMIANKKYYLSRSYQYGMDSCIKRSCNVNNDNLCDEEDLKILDKSFGQCNKPGNYNYNSDADIDNDECITDKDRKIVENELGTDGWVCKDDLDTN